MNSNEENNEPNKESNPFSLPGDYFNSFSKKMMLKIELVEELKEFALLSSIDKKLPFITPENYFETKAELLEYPVLMALKNKAAFRVPENYFASSVEKIRLSIELSEELNTYPSLAAIDKQVSFVTPERYFETLTQVLNQKTSTNASSDNTYGKIIHLVFNKKTAYAIAATLVISLGLYLYNAKTLIAGNDCNTIACLDRNEILIANQLNNFDEDALMEIVNTEALSKNLNNKLKEENKKTDNQKNNEDYVLENVDVNDIADEI